MLLVVSDCEADEDNYNYKHDFIVQMHALIKVSIASFDDTIAETLIELRGARNEADCDYKSLASQVKLMDATCTNIVAITVLEDKLPNEFDPGKIVEMLGFLKTMDGLDLATGKAAAVAEVVLKKRTALLSVLHEAVQTLASGVTQYQPVSDEFLRHFASLDTQIKEWNIQASDVEDSPQLDVFFKAVTAGYKNWHPAMQTMSKAKPLLQSEGLTAIADFANQISAFPGDDIARICSLLMAVQVILLPSTHPNQKLAMEKVITYCTSVFHFKKASFPRSIQERIDGLHAVGALPYNDC